MRCWTEPDGTLHEIYTGTIFVGNSYLGSFEYDSGRGDLGYNRFGTAYFCRHCGEVWARIIATDSRGNTNPFHVFERPCEQHPDSWNIPGSLLMRQFETLLDDFPPEAVVREFKLHMEYFLKELV